MEAAFKLHAGLQTYGLLWRSRLGAIETRLFFIAALALLPLLGGCSPDQTLIDNAKAHAHLDGEKQLEEVKQSIPPLIPEFYVRGLYVVTGANWEGSWLTSYTVTGYFYIWSTYYIVAMVLLAVGGVVVGMIAEEAAAAPIIIAFGWIQFLILWAIAAVLGMAVTAWPGFLFCLSITLMPVEAGGIAAVEHFRGLQKARKQMAVALAEQQSRAKAEAEVARLRAVEEAAAERARAANEAAQAKAKVEEERVRAMKNAEADLRKRKLAKGN